MFDHCDLSASRCMSSSRLRRDNGESTVISAYVCDVINITPSLSAMASVHVDRFEGKPVYWVAEEVSRQTSVSPKLGIVYQPIRDKVSVFANYMNGFVNVPPSEVADIDGSNPRQEESLSMGRIAS